MKALAGEDSPACGDQPRLSLRLLLLPAESLAGYFHQAATVSRTRRIALAPRAGANTIEPSGRVEAAVVGFNSGPRIEIVMIIKIVMTIQTTGGPRGRGTSGRRPACSPHSSPSRKARRAGSTRSRQRGTAATARSRSADGRRCAWRRVRAAPGMTGTQRTPASVFESATRIRPPARSTWRRRRPSASLMRRPPKLNVASIGRRRQVSRSLRTARASSALAASSSAWISSG